MSDGATSDGKRPGGLTALAVLNFVFGGLGAIGLLAIFALIGAVEHTVAAANSAAAGSEGVKVTEVTNSGLVWVSLLLAFVTVALMITSGVGYLGQKRFLGRTMGNAYAIVSLASTGVGLAVQKFGIGTMVGLVYPLLTLALINTTFKDDLVN